MKIVKDKIKKEVSSINKELRNRLTSYIMAAFGVVAGLAWNDAIKEMIEYVFPMEQSGLMAKFVYALIITAALVVMSIYTVRILKTKDTKKDK